ncbi:trimethyllysine dioxygenase [Legionella lansingensis]|uniref:Taurine catabolism dioxygenase TauD, TfdA family n=1 Tax=Legionella lansingensis TaxID=45067 RepID=A0A0W0VMR8_9GAMM|nr:TauD/TfdA family dioxygenase [Legionella lansingensis]KTD21418.1 Taurine catabolism dioxygenase TauD, TfdA family [Legionella lansingensis]SNV51959.1 trimethyllysine dioxygenase [Legionella lansingensis]
MNQTNINNPLKWHSKDITNGSSHLRDLSNREKDIILQALVLLENENLSWDNSDIKNLLLTELQALYDEIMHALIHIRGFITLTGLPSSEDKYSPEVIKKFFLAFCSPLGIPLKQNKNQDLIFDVKSIEGMTLDTKNSRGPYVKEALPMHTDAGAILGMYCFASADVGGHTLLSSSRTVHDEIKKIRPDLLDVLYQGFYADRRGNELEGSLPYDLSPVFAMYGNQLRCQYHQPFYNDAQKKFPDIPRYTPQQSEALELFDKVSLQKDIAFETKLEPGNIIFINNEEILHGRTTFDHPENQSLRYLLRIWLNTPEIEHTFPSFLGYPV